MPRFDKNGEMIGLTVCKVSDNLKMLQELAGKIGLEGTFNDNFRIFHDLTTLHEEVERFKILIHH